MVVLDTPHRLLVVRQGGHTLLLFKAPQLHRAVACSTACNTSSRAVACWHCCSQTPNTTIRAQSQGSSVGVTVDPSCLIGWPDPYELQLPAAATCSAIGIAAGGLTVEQCVCCTLPSLFPRPRPHDAGAGMLLHRGWDPQTVYIVNARAALEVRLT